MLLECTCHPATSEGGFDTQVGVGFPVHPWKMKRIDMKCPCHVYIIYTYCMYILYIYIHTLFQKVAVSTPPFSFQKRMTRGTRNSSHIWKELRTANYALEQVQQMGGFFCGKKKPPKNKPIKMVWGFARF